MNKFSALFLSLLLVLALPACKKSNLIGSDVLPAGDNLDGIYTDTFTVTAKTVREVSIPTSTSSKYVLGAMEDAVFGKSSAGIYTELIPNTFNPTLRNSTIDSVVMCLEYAGSYGDVKAAPQSVKVYRMTENMSDDSAYYSSRTFGVEATPIGQKQNFTPDLSSPVYEYGDTLQPHLRIRLDDGFGQTLLNADSLNYASLTAFQNFMKGFYIMPDTTSWAKGLMYFNLTGAASRFVIFYHTNTTSGLRFTFAISDRCARSNHFTHNYAGTPVSAALSSAAGSDSLLYVQSMAGVKSKITFPSLKNLGNVLINKAEIEVRQVLTTEDGTFPAPAKMFIVKSDSLGRDVTIPDMNSGHALSYGGAKVNITTSGGQTVATYTFSIADQMQAIINGGITDYGLFLINSQSNETADRVVTGGPARSDAAQLKLKLIYTKLP